MTTINLDSDHHWLSPLGRVNRKVIRDRNRAKHRAEHPPVHKAARPETMARLRKVKKRIEKRELFRKVTVWNNAIAIIDQSEIKIRDMIERDLEGVAGISGIHYGEAMRAADKLMKKIKIIRVRAIKKAFRHLRSKLG